MTQDPTAEVKTEWWWGWEEALAREENSEDLCCSGEGSDFDPKSPIEVCSLNWILYSRDQGGVSTPCVGTRAALILQEALCEGSWALPPPHLWPTWWQLVGSPPALVEHSLPVNHQAEKEGRTSWRDAEIGKCQGPEAISLAFRLVDVVKGIAEVDWSKSKRGLSPRGPGDSQLLKLCISDLSTKPNRYTRCETSSLFL